MSKLGRISFHRVVGCNLNLSTNATIATFVGLPARFYIRSLIAYDFSGNVSAAAVTLNGYSSIGGPIGIIGVNSLIGSYDSQSAKVLTKSGGFDQLCISTGCSVMSEEAEGSAKTCSFMLEVIAM